MAETHIQVDETKPQENTPLLKVDQSQESQNYQNQLQLNEKDPNLNKALLGLETFLTFLGFNQSSTLRTVLSWLVFFVIGVSLPVVILELSNCPGCEKGQIKSFEIDIVASQACLAAASLICLSHHLRKYGIRKFLFVDRYSGHVERFSAQYVQKIAESMRLLVLWLLPCLILKTAREIIRIMYVPHQSWWESVGIMLAFVCSWTYVTTVFLSSCILFHLVCYLQVLHFEDYGKLLESESDVMVLIQEHARLRHYLSKISHRFRIYLLLEFLIVTASQFVTLFQTTGYTGIITFTNAGDFAVSSIVQVVGVTLCLNAAAKISHRAQGIASLASRWHALATCSTNEASHLRSTNSLGNLEALNMSASFLLENSESDLESLDIAMPRNGQLASQISSYNKRQALVLYLQMNPGGITIFGWTVDRGLINTIFFIQLSLVLFVLGKTIVFTTN